MKINQYVVKRHRGWAVVGEENSRDTVVLATRDAAIARASKIAAKLGAELIIHDGDKSDLAESGRSR